MTESAGLTPSALTRYRLWMEGATGLFRLDPEPDGEWVKWAEVEARHNRYVGLLTDEEQDKYRWMTKAEELEATVATLRAQLESAVTEEEAVANQQQWDKLLDERERKIGELVLELDKVKAGQASGAAEGVSPLTNDEVIVIREAVRSLDCGDHYCRYCAAKSPLWAHSEHCPYLRSQNLAEQARVILDRVQAAVLAGGVSEANKP